MTYNKPGASYHGFTYSELVSEGMKSQKRAQPWFDLLSDAKKVQEQYKEFHKMVRRNRPGLADNEIRDMFLSDNKWVSGGLEGFI